MLRLFEIFVSLFYWHACKLAKLSFCVSKYMTTLNKIYIFYILHTMWLQI